MSTLNYDSLWTQNITNEKKEYWQFLKQEEDFYAVIVKKILSDFKCYKDWGNMKKIFQDEVDMLPLKMRKKTESISLNFFFI